MQAAHMVVEIKPGREQAVATSKTPFKRALKELHKDTKIN